MSFDPINLNIPNVDDDPVDDAPLIQQNFNGFAQRWAVNHIPYTDSAYNGYHTKLFFPAAVSAPNLTAPASSVYPKLDLDGIVQLFFQNGPLSANEVQLTGNFISNVPGRYILPGGIKIIWGTAQATQAGNTNQFPTGGFSNTWNPIVIAIRTGLVAPTTLATINTSNTGFTAPFNSTGGFTAYSNISGTVDLYYIAIGKAP